jgi:hypothetical protein
VKATITFIIDIPDFDEVNMMDFAGDIAAFTVDDTIPARLDAIAEDLNLSHLNLKRIEFKAMYALNLGGYSS